MARHQVVSEPAAGTSCPVRLREHSPAKAGIPHWDVEQPPSALASSGEVVDQAHLVVEMAMSLALLGAETEGSLEQQAGRSAAVSAVPDWKTPAEAEFGQSLAGMNLLGLKAFA